MNEMRWGVPTSSNNQSECTQTPIKKMAMFFRDTRDQNTFELGFNDFLITFEGSTIHVEYKYVMCTVNKDENNRQYIDEMRPSVTMLSKMYAKKSSFFSLLFLLLDFECIDR